ncbi:hypothetical protein J6590_105185 [Homalodisca vitripennis]|nr:hypothetical protein J6590_105185 [Homalodisca vitripennis]
MLDYLGINTRHDPENEQIDFDRDEGLVVLNLAFSVQEPTSFVLLRRRRGCGLCSGRLRAVAWHVISSKGRIRGEVNFRSDSDKEFPTLRPETTPWRLVGSVLMGERLYIERSESMVTSNRSKEFVQFISDQLLNSFFRNLFISIR